MRWRRPRRSAHVEDRRGVPGGRKAAAGVSGLGLLLVVALALLTGADPAALLEGIGGGSGSDFAAPAQHLPSAHEDELSELMSVVLASTEDEWHSAFREQGRVYREPTLVLYSDSVASACGYAQAAVGPFYCPADQKVYIDLGFFRELEQRFGAPGDFAQSYVLAHEVGHHVQTLLGITQQIEAARRRMSQTDSNALLVRLELQADCLAGAWANRAQRHNLVLDMGDLEEGLRAASALGDDRLQMQAQGYVVPDAFTHGTSAQRSEWFRRGLASGEINACDTFADL